MIRTAEEYISPIKVKSKAHQSKKESWAFQKEFETALKDSMAGLLEPSGTLLDNYGKERTIRDIKKLLKVF